MQVQEVVTFRNLRLPELDKTGYHSIKAIVFDNDEVKYDIILGTSSLLKAGNILNYSEREMEIT